MGNPSLIRRRLPGLGWAIERGGAIEAVKLDDGPILRRVDALVGTTEAARALGVRSPNFVRDWASRPDFPAPLASLSSGRIWSAAEVKDFSAVHRSMGSPIPDDHRPEEIARRIVWWQSPQLTLSRPRDFLARAMALGTLEEVHDLQARFGRRRLREALLAASPGVFDRRTWNYWLLVLGMDRGIPMPVRRVP